MIPFAIQPFRCSCKAMNIFGRMGSHIIIPRKCVRCGRKVGP